MSVRAGHAGVSIDDNWYVVGGGDNKSGKSLATDLTLLYFLHNVE